MVLVTYTGRASRVHIGDGIVLRRGEPVEVHPLLGLPLQGRRGFDVLELSEPAAITHPETDADDVVTDGEATEDPTNPPDEPKET